MYVDFAIENKNFYDLNPLICGHEYCKSSHSFGPAKRSHYLIHYVVNGKGVFYTATETYHVKKGECFLIKPDEITTYVADKYEPWYYIWIGFNGNLAKKLDNIETPVFKMPSNVFEEMLNINEYPGTREEFLTGKLFAVFSYIFIKEKRDNHIEIVKNYISNNYMRKIYIEDIAKIVNLDRHYLSNIFKDSVGITMKEYLTKKRMLEAKNLLQTNHSVTEVCFMVGYDDIFVFSKAFKNYYGVSPKNWIKSRL